MYLLIAALALAAPAPPEDPRKDEVKIQGTWAVVALAAEGWKVRPEEVKDLKLVFEDDTLTILEGANKERLKFKLDPTKKPRRIDLDPKERGGPVVLGIYELDGDRLTLCWSERDKAPRPTEFAVKDSDSDTVLLTLKRERMKK